MRGSTVRYTLGVLCGGAGRRMGGRDKGLLEWGGNSFAQTLVNNLAFDSSVEGAVVIGANRHLEKYRMPGARVVTDLRKESVGPLGGLEAILAACDSHRPLVLVPCDMPALPAHTPARLLAELRTRDTIAMLHDGRRRQPLCLALMPQRWRDDLSCWLDGGGRSVSGWLRDKPVTEVFVPDDSQCSFVNVNYPSDYSRLTSLYCG